MISSWTSYVLVMYPPPAKTHQNNQIQILYKLVKWLDYILISSHSIYKYCRATFCPFLLKIYFRTHSRKNNPTVLIRTLTWCTVNLVFSYYLTMQSKYTERQKKLITSSERHSLKSEALKWIIIGHRLAIELLTKHISKIKHLIESKESQIRWYCKRSFF